MKLKKITLLSFLLVKMKNYGITELGDTMYELALSILKRISYYGYDAYIVGGYPRDRYRGVESTDIDICTNLPLSKIQELFEVLETHFASSIIVVEGIQFEITAFRRDSDYEKHRFPKTVELVNQLEIDLERRDFIMNTLCIDQYGHYIDLLGAKQDIDDKIIRIVGNTQKKLCEDVLRMLRAIRFATTLDFTLDEEIKKVILAYGYLLKYLSKARIQKELTLILHSPNKEKGIALLRELKIDSVIEMGL